MISMLTLSQWLWREQRKINCANRVGQINPTVIGKEVKYEQVQTRSLSLFYRMHPVGLTNTQVNGCFQITFMINRLMIWTSSFISTLHLGNLTWNLPLRKVYFWRTLAVFAPAIFPIYFYLFRWISPGIFTIYFYLFRWKRGVKTTPYTTVILHQSTFLTRADLLADP